MNHVEEAKRDFEKAVKYNPNFGPGHVQKCYADYRYMIFNRNGNPMHKAEIEFKEVMKKYSDRPEGYMLCGQVVHNCFRYFDKERDVTNKFIVDCTRFLTFTIIIDR